MHSSDDDIITTEVEIITYVEESDGIYKNVKVEDASPVESSFHSDITYCKVEQFDDQDLTIKSESKPDIYMNEERDKTTCKSCNQSFSKYSDVLKHECSTESKLKRKSNKKTLHSCEVCGKTFKLFAHLKRHSVLHTGEKQYICDVCKRPFADKSSMRKHCQTHSGEKNFKCDICEKCFTQRSHMKTHLLIHTGEKSYECKFCGKTFRHGNNYRTHVRTHTGEKPYYCTACKKSFNDGSCYRRHLKRNVHKKMM